MAKADTEAVARCEALLAAKDFGGCLAAATALVERHEGCWQGWWCRGGALFQLGRYPEARAALRAALATGCGRMRTAEEAIRRMLESSLLLESLARAGTDDAPGARLRAGWYSAHLTASLETLGPPGGGIQDCVVLDRFVDAWAARGEDRISSGWDGGERSVPAGLFAPFPCSQATGGEVFFKDRLFLFRCRAGLYDTKAACYEGDGPCSRCRRVLMPLHAFPHWDVELPAAVQRPHPELDVLFARGLVPDAVHVKLIAHLDGLANKRQDFPMPHYHNIIDPNIGSVDGLWVPADVDVTVSIVRPFEVLRLLMLAAARSVGRRLPPHVGQRVLAFVGADRSVARCLLASPIPDLPPVGGQRVLYWAINYVLQAALPLLGALRRPSLLLPGPLQVVVKAQRIHLKANEDYAGVWHQDGLREHIVAVVLYYYRASECLAGGALEFASRRRTALWTGDAGGTVLSRGAVEAVAGELPKGKVPIEEGTMVVFSNYQNLHRVLPIISSGTGSRDFLAFFVVDQTKPLPTPSELPPLEERRARRMALLQEQLQPRGQFGVDGNDVYSTGNGSVADLGWVRDATRVYERDFNNPAVVGPLASLNAPPPLGRGVSYLLGDLPPGWSWNPDSAWVEHRVGPLDADAPARRFYVRGTEARLEPPAEGLSDVRYFATMAQWRVQMYNRLWSEDDDFYEAMSAD